MPPEVYGKTICGLYVRDEPITQAGLMRLVVAGRELILGKRLGVKL